MREESSLSRCLACEMYDFLHPIFVSGYQHLFLNSLFAVLDAMSFSLISIGMMPAIQSKVILRVDEKPPVICSVAIF